MSARRLAECVVQADCIGKQMWLLMKEGEKEEGRKDERKREGEKRAKQEIKLICK